MKRILILLICIVCSNAFAMEGNDYRESQPSTPTWKKVTNYLGFGLSTNLKIPTVTTTKIAYSVFSIGLGISELFLTDKIGDPDQPFLTSQNILATGFMAHGVSNILHGTSILTNMIWNAGGSWCGISSQTSNAVKEQLYDKIQTSVQIIGGATLIIEGNTQPATLLKGVGFCCGIFSLSKGLLTILWKKSSNQNAKPWHRMYNGFLRLTAGASVNAIYLYLNPPTPIIGGTIFESDDPSYVWIVSQQEICKYTHRTQLKNCIPNNGMLKTIDQDGRNTIPDFTPPDPYHYFYPGLLLLASGFSELSGGTKDTILLMGLIWNSVRTQNTESNSTALSFASALNTRTNRGYQQNSKIQRKETNKPRDLAQDSSSSFSHESQPEEPKSILSTWREERDQLLCHGITIESGPFGETILRCGDVTKTIKTPQSENAKVTGKKAETIRSMISIAWEKISTTYSVASIAIQADLNPLSHYVFRSPCNHWIITQLVNCKSYRDVKITRTELQSFLSFLEKKEQEEQSIAITNKLDLGYYYDTSRGEGSHAMYSLGRGMGAMTLSKPKHGRNPDELSPEQVKDLKIALIRKGAILDS